MSRKLSDWQMRTVIVFLAVGIAFLGVVVYAAADPHNIFTDGASWYKQRVWKRDDNASHGGRSIDGQRLHHMSLDEGCGQIWIRDLDATQTPSCVVLPVALDTDTQADIAGRE